MHSILKKMKRHIALVLALFIAFAAVAPKSEAASIQIYVNDVKQTYTGKQWKVTYNGTNINISKTPGLTLNGTGMVPFYQTLVKAGPKMKYKYDSKTYTLTLTYGSKTLVLKNKSKTATLNGTKKTLSAAPARVKYPNGTTAFMVPIKNVCSLMGLTYSYTNSTSTIKISKSSSSSSAASAITTSTKASSLKNLSTAKFIAKLGPIAQADYKRTGVLASVTLAQAILESGWAKSDLALNANNLFGMKKSLSGNTWSGSTWDGKSTYTKKTAEYSGSKKYYIYAAFRKYSSIELSIADHSAYLTGAKNGSKLRYAGLTSTTSYTKQLQIIKNGGYATSSTYVSQLSKVIKTYNLTKYDKK